MSTHFHALRVKSITPDTDEAVIVSFEVPAALQHDFQFTQGQHLTLRTQLNGQRSSAARTRSARAWTMASCALACAMSLAV